MTRWVVIAVACAAVLLGGIVASAIGYAKLYSRVGVLETDLALMQGKRDLLLVAMAESCNSLAERVEKTDRDMLDNLLSGLSIEKGPPMPRPARGIGGGEKRAALPNREGAKPKKKVKHGQSKR